ncbi:MAG: thioredoxin [Candidatus Goldbacteria bacterium]|nr:thioredoxin [Candidatus Goldiibacteriota bacterium]
MEINVDSKSFKKEVIESKEPVLVDFWAEWCMPCKMVAPALSQIAKEYNGKLTVAKVNVDDSPELAGMYGVSGIPTMAIFKDGKVVDRIVGALPKQHIIQAIKPHLAA